MKALIGAALALAVGYLAALGSAAAAPPRVAKTTPANGDMAVSPAVREIRVVFDQPMDPRSYSFVGGGPKFPKVRGQAKWLDERTCVLPVSLEADHDYWVGINSASHGNFRNTRGESAVPYPIAFRTAGGPGAKPAVTLTPRENRPAIENLRRAILRDYSYRDRMRLDWSALFRKWQPTLLETPSPGRFAAEAGRMLAPAQDMHLWLSAEGVTFPTFRRNVEPNFNKDTLARIVPSWRQRSEVVYSGRFDGGIHYVLVTSWLSEHAPALEQVYDVLWEAHDSEGLVVDVRPNSGGSEDLAQQFAGCFLDERKAYAKHVFRRDGGLTEPSTRTVLPNKRRPRFRGKVAVLMGQANMSSCEAFLLMMRQVPRCRLVGERSWGSSGNPKPHDLGNGVTVYVPSWQSLQLDGTGFEGEGLAPHIAVQAKPDDFAKADPVLEAALRWLRSGATPEAKGGP